MPSQNQFQGSGIVDGQTVEANQVSQSVDAFTAQKDYDIFISGSLTVTGSVNLTGSLINEFTGEFKTLGIGTSAPTEPTMLHIKENNLSGDPIVLIEGTAGGDEARLRLKNATISYDMGVYGSQADSFQIVQDQTKIPFKINNDNIDYTLYLSNGNIGIGMGANTPALINNLPVGSIHVLHTITGSEGYFNLVSASNSPYVEGEVTLHGTASYANFANNAITASYIGATDVDFSFSISQQINHQGTISAITSSYQYLKVSDVSGIALKEDSTNNYHVFLSGSTEPGTGICWIGNSENGSYIEIDNNDDQVKFYAGAVRVNGDLKVRDDAFISGSSNPKLVVGPVANPGTPNTPSASLFPESLQFNDNNIAYVGNYNTAATSQLWLSAGGGGGSTVALAISASKDIKLSGSLNIVAKNPVNNIDLKAYYNYGDLNNATPKPFKSLYRIRDKQTGFINSPIKVIEFGTVSSQTNWNAGYDRVVNFKATLLGMPSAGAPNGVYVERSAAFYWDSSASTWVVMDIGSTIRRNLNSDYAASGFNYNIAGSGTSIEGLISPGTAVNTDWTGWVEVTMISKLG